MHPASILRPVMSLDFAAIRAAHERIRPYIKRTPVLTNDALDAAHRSQESLSSRGAKSNFSNGYDRSKYDSIHRSARWFRASSVSRSASFARDFRT